MVFKNKKTFSKKINNILNFSRTLPGEILKVTSIIAIVLLLSWGVSVATTDELENATNNFSVLGKVSEISEDSISLVEGTGSDSGEEKNYKLNIKYLDKVETSDYSPLIISDIKPGYTIIAQGVTNGSTFFIKRIVSFSGTPLPVSEIATTTPDTVATTTDSDIATSTDDTTEDVTNTPADSGSDTNFETNSVDDSATTTDSDTSTSTDGTTEDVTDTSTDSGSDTNSETNSVDDSATTTDTGSDSTPSDVTPSDVTEDVPSEEGIIEKTLDTVSDVLDTIVDVITNSNEVDVEQVAPQP